MTDEQLNMIQTRLDELGSQVSECQKLRGQYKGTVSEAIYAASLILLKQDAIFLGQLIETEKTKGKQ